MATLTFDKPNRIMTVASPDTSITIQSIYDQCRDYEDELVNFDIDHLVQGAGKDDLGGGLFVGITLTLRNWTLAFEARSGPSWTICGVDEGNLLAVNATGVYVQPIEPTSYISVNTAKAVSAALLSGGDSALNATQNAQLMGLPNATRIASNVWAFPATPVVSDTMQSRVVDIYNLVASPFQYKADVSNLALALTSASILELVASPYQYKADLSLVSEQIPNQQKATYNGMVFIDTTSTHAGVGYPRGTTWAPVNNLTDALTIAEDIGAHILHLHTNLTVTATHNINSYKIQTDGQLGIELTLNQGCSTNQTIFAYVELGGYFNGGVFLDRCKIKDDVYNFNGIMLDTIIGADVNATGTAESFILDCWSDGGGTSPTLFVDEALMRVEGFSGNLEIAGKTANNDLRLSLDSGQVTVASSCVRGTIAIKGTGRLVSDDSTASCVVTTQDLIDANQLIPPLNRTLGLVQENFRIKNQVYTASLLTAASILIYANATDTVADATPTERYELSASYDAGGLCTSYRVIRIP